MEKKAQKVGIFNSMRLSLVRVQAQNFILNSIL